MPADGTAGEGGAGEGGAGGVGAVWRRALGLASAVGVFGVSFGVLSATAGVPVPIACAMSVLVFAGGSQFAALGVVVAGGSPVAAVAAGLLLNARYAAFGVAVAPVLRGSPLRRALAAQLVIDESSAMALAERDPDVARRAFWVTGGAVFVLWNAGTLVGALAGSGIADPAVYGLDAAFPAGFLALLGPLLRGRRARTAAAGGVLLALALTPVTPPGVPILVSALGALAGLAVREPGPPVGERPASGVSR